ncbi:MAG: ABC transporter substrate-binding protein [Chloroflexota bacterium]
MKRRDFLKLAFGAGLVMTAGCATPASPTVQPTAAPAAQPAASPAAPAAKATSAPVAGTPKPTGTLTVAIPSIGNPAYTPKMIDSFTSVVATAFSEALLGRNSDLSSGPTRLAETWSVSPDGKALTFDLRKGIKFHDGSDVTSEDVKFTFEQAVLPDSINLDAAFWRTAMERIETPTPQRVVIYLKERNLAAQHRIAGPSSNSQMISSKNYVQRVGESAANQKPIGTGPFRFVEFKAGELIRFEAVENHWRQTPAFKELILRQVPEESTRVSMILRGEADLAIIGFAQSKRLQDGGASIFVDESSHCIYVSLQGQYLPTRPKFDPKVPWAADPADQQAWARARKVREAMNVAIDHQTIINTVLSGQGKRATYVYAVPGTPFEDPSWKPVQYDPARAKQLLAEAGYGNGFEFPFLLVEWSGRPGGPQIGEAVAQYWQAVGLKPKLAPADYTAKVRPGIVARSLPGTAYEYASYVYAEPAIGHAGGFASTADGSHGAEYLPLDDLATKALSTGNNEERKALELQMGKMVMDEFFTVPVAWVNSLWGGSKKIKTFPRIAGVVGPYNFEYVVPVG